MTTQRAAERTPFGFRVVTPLIASAVLNPVNSTLITVALVPIGQSFGAGPARTAWLISSLYLATAVAQPVVGLFVDRFGARRVLLTGAAVVIAAGLGGLLALSLPWLVGVRVVLGIGTCAGFPAAMAVVRTRADAAGSGVPSRVLSVLGMSSQTVMAIGPALAGALIGLFGWPAIFAVNIPLGMVALVSALLWVPRDERPARTGVPVDIAGIVLFAATLVVLLFFVMAPSVHELYLVAVTAVLAVAFAWRELRAGEPFIDLRVLAGNSALLLTYLRQALGLLIVYSMMYGYAQWLEAAHGFSESKAGLVMVPMSVIAMLASAASGRATGVRIRLVLAASALCGGSGLLFSISSATPFAALAGLAALFGLGQGLIGVTNQTALYGQVSADAVGTASGLFRTAQYLGAIAASTLIALCFGSHVTSAGLHRLAWSLAGVGVVLLAVTVTDRGLGAPAGAR
ncbi:MFS transporter [Amycolatopsis acidicola]|uniref:MFS transporter n=1 Tax=Amycolatopsis acidicola TaxID=2596893 RepID=A0A5N0VCU3_9PSEU|nr:MFS transporter [Amycolatopsis acidicola]KAA9163304.1 MFS transporter [Amycolatopsis acidicola]